MERDDRWSVLVTGVGGGVGQSILKSFRGSGFRAVAADGDVLGTGLFAADRSYVVPYATSPAFIDRIVDICAREQCKLVFPGLDAELPVLAQARERFREAGITCVVSAPEVVEICDDKLRTSQFLLRAGLPAPRTCKLSGRAQLAEIAFPMVLKPMRGGRRSIGVCVARNPSELERMLQQLDLDNYVAQEWIDGDEYTCGTVSFDGRCRGVIVMRRTLRDGDTYKAFVEIDPVIEQAVRKAADALAPFGACNFQLRMRDGLPYIFEINARSSGTTFCRALAGFNEPVMVANYLLLGMEPDFSIRPISVFRYWKELVVDNGRVDHLAERGWIDGDGSAL